MPDPADPKPLERRYVRHAQTGELGYLVVRDGVQVVRLDNDRQEITRRYVPGDWVGEEIRRHLTPMAIGRIAFEADKALCRELGMHRLAARTWEKLPDGQRQDFAVRGPGGQRRDALWRAIRANLSGDKPCP